MHIQSKLPQTGMTIFSVMTALANEYGAINLSQGFPDFDVHPELIDRVAHYMRQGHNQYAPMQGVMALREKIAAKVRSLHGASYDPESEITVTSGATEAVFAAISSVIRTGDETIVVEPAYDAYEPAIRLSGGEPVFVKLIHPEYRLDWDEVARAVSPRTRMIILNSPHNPTGSVLTGDDMRALCDLVKGSEIFILGDEVYEHIIFDGLGHESLCRHPELARRSFVVSSFGKTYHTTGWKIGYCVAPAPLSREFQKVHQYLTFAANTPVQCAYADFMDKKDQYLELGDFYQQKRDLLLNLVAPSRFKALPCRGTYFQLLDYSVISNEPDTEFARRMTVEHGVAAIPPSVFYREKDDRKVLRFCFAKNDETLEQAAQKLCKI